MDRLRDLDIPFNLQPLYQPKDAGELVGCFCCFWPHKIACSRDGFGRFPIVGRREAKRQ
jgi:hypothetical protein